MKKLISYILEKFKLFGFALFVPLLIIFLFIVLPIKSCEFLNNFNNSVKTENLTKTNEDVLQPDSSCLQRKSFEFVYKSNDDYTICSDGMLNFYDDEYYSYDRLIESDYTGSDSGDSELYSYVDSAMGILYKDAAKKAKQKLNVYYYREINSDSMISQMNSTEKLIQFLTHTLYSSKDYSEDENILFYEKFVVNKADTMFFNSNIKNTILANDTIQLNSNMYSTDIYTISKKILKENKVYITNESIFYRDLE